ASARAPAFRKVSAGSRPRAWALSATVQERMRSFPWLIEAKRNGLAVRVLVVEDEKKVAAAIRRGLEAEGFAVDIAQDGTEGEWLANQNPYDAIVLDIMLPGLNGYKLCERIRDAGNWTPILMLTAKDGDYDIAEALDTGADDYLTKPFSFVVLLARIRALLRRSGMSERVLYEAGDLVLDPAAPPSPRARPPLRLPP